jgi:hypothetical protein
MPKMQEFLKGVTAVTFAYCIENALWLTDQSLYSDSKRFFKSMLLILANSALIEPLFISNLFKQNSWSIIGLDVNSNDIHVSFITLSMK